MRGKKYFTPKEKFMSYREDLFTLPRKVMYQRKTTYEQDLIDKMNENWLKGKNSKVHPADKKSSFRNWSPNPKKPKPL